MNTLQTLSRRLWSLAAVAVCASLFSTASNLRAADPVTEDSVPARAENGSGSNDALRAYLQLQEQIHITQLSLERDRKESREAAAALKEAVIGQRERELNAMQSTNVLMLKVAAGFGIIGFLAMVATAFLQWRAVTRLAEVAAMIPLGRQALPAPLSGVETPLLSNTATEQSSQRLFGALTQLEKRIHELEHTAHPATTDSGYVTATGTNGNGTHTIEAEHTEEEDHDSLLLAKAQSLLDLEKGEQALEAINEILLHEPNNPEALVKKGIAHEQLRQSDEALICYDRAIELNSGLTIAYLQKGGLFNRMERYEEALQCYEQALRAQEKAHHS
jgi:tetratricopeptide (TPR) repeat protein